MSTAAHMTREEFLDWAAAQDQRYEFDDFQPVAMTGQTLDHCRIAGNIYFALCMRLYGAGFRAMGRDAGVATVEGAVRYPDALVTRPSGLESNRLVPDVVVVFEVLSEASGYTDRIEKLREYQAVPSIRRYVMLEDTGVGLVVLSRIRGDDPWTATALIDGDILRMPEIKIEIPIAEFYEGTDLMVPPNPGIGQGASTTP
jgi:Uma2 family endonuclease